MAGKSPAVVDIDAFGLAELLRIQLRSRAENGHGRPVKPGRQHHEHQHRARRHPRYLPAMSAWAATSTPIPGRRSFDLSLDEANAQAGQENRHVSEDATLPILQQVTEIIVLEIQKTFDFFRASAGGEDTSKRIYPAGGPAKVPGLVEGRRARNSRCLSKS